MKTSASFDCERSIAHATDQFKQIKDYVRGEAQTQDAYTVERRLFKESMKLALCMMGAYFEQKQGGDRGQVLSLPDGSTLPRERLHAKQLVTVFGELDLKRWYYHEDGAPGVFPLDEEVNLPQRSFSYYVQETLGRTTTGATYDEVMAEMQRLYGFAPYKHSVEAIVEQAACDVGSFYDSRPPVSPETEAEILVAAIDGKGVPMVKDNPAEHKLRLGRGEKLSRKKEATVSALYTIAPYQRGVEEIISEVRDKEYQARRPRPHNKQVQATLDSKQAMMQWVAREVERRDPDGTKARVCIMDGSKGLWTQARRELQGFTFVLDLFHVLEYLWKVAHVFYAENTRDSSGTGCGCCSRAKWATSSAACRHLVKDRMEGSGMRWKINGAEAVLQLRALYLNGDWDDYWQHHMQCEYERRFATTAA